MEYWLVMTGSREEPGIARGLYPRSDEFPYSPVNVIAVEEIDEALAKIVAEGNMVGAMQFHEM